MDVLADAADEADNLPDGYLLRAADPDDRSAIEGLVAGAIHPEAGPEVRQVLDTTEYGAGAFLVVEHDGRVVAVTALLEGEAELSGVALPFGQLEFVATAAGHRRRGLVRAMSEVAHAASHARGDVFQLARGVEYLYRRLGYEYAVLLPRRHRLRGLPDHQDGSRLVRNATDADEPEIRRLQESVFATADLVVRPGPHHYRWLGGLEHYSMLVAERDGAVEAAARAYMDDEGIELSETVAMSQEAANAVLVHAARLGGGGRPITVPDRAGGGAYFLAGGTEPEIGRDGYYIRIGDPLSFVGSLRPVLDARLAASAFHSWSGTVEVSRYVDGLRIVVERGVVGYVESVDPDELGTGATAVPPDLFATLAFGEHGAAGLEELHPDVVLGDLQRPLLRTLFPAVSADLILY